MTDMTHSTPPAASGDGWRSEIAATFSLAWPLVLANLLQMLIYAIDVIFIARLGQEPLAASALAVAIYGLVMWALTGLTGAVAPLIAAELGARAPALRPIRRATRMAVWLCVISGLAAMALVTFSEEFMLLTGQQPQIAALAGDYMLVLMFSMIPMLIANVLRNFVSALGRPIFATFITAGGIGVNALGNYAFIFGNFGAPRLELAGAAIATCITAVLTMLAYIAAIRTDRNLHRYHIWGRFWSPDWRYFGEILRIGTPIALTILAEAGIFGTAAFLMGNIGAAQLAGHTVALQIAAFSFQVPFGISQAATIRVGYFYGARNRTGMTRAGWSAIAMGVGFMATAALTMIAIPETLLSIYVDTNNPANAALVGFALQYLVVAAAFQLFDGFQAVAAGALRGLQDTRVPMWIAIFSYWVPGFGTAAVLGFTTPLQGTGIWMGLAAGLMFSAIFLTWRWIARERIGLIPQMA